MVLDHAEEARCAHCGLQIHQCGNCRGIAGPFDRYCGFCGHELLRGQQRSVWWRLWLLAALVPLSADLTAMVANIPISLVASLRVRQNGGGDDEKPCLRLRPLRPTDPPIVLALPALPPLRG